MSRCQCQHQGAFPGALWNFPSTWGRTGQAGEEGWRCARQPRWQPRPLLTRPELGMWVGGGAGHPNQTHPGHPHTNRPSIRPKTPNHPLSSYSSLPLGYIESNSSSCGISPLASLWKGEIANYRRNWLGQWWGYSQCPLQWQTLNSLYTCFSSNWNCSVGTKACVQWSDFS